MHSFPIWKQSVFHVQLYLNDYNPNSKIFFLSDYIANTFQLGNIQSLWRYKKMALIHCIWFKFLEDDFAKLQVFDSLISLHEISH